MAAVLNNQGNIEKISFFMEECRKMGIPVLGPDINESAFSFGTNKKGEIRFGMAGIKGVGEKAVESIIEERRINGAYSDLFDFAKRINSRTVNKRVYENLVYSGAFDCFGYHRAQFFFKAEGSMLNGIERLIKYNSDYQNSLTTSQSSLFGGTSDAEIAEPQLLDCPEWGLIEKLKYERDMIGIYLTGHPLDNYKFEMDHFCQHKVNHLALINKAKSGELSEVDAEEFGKIKNRELVIGGLVSSAAHRTTKMGKPFGAMMFEDYKESFEIALFGEDYVKHKPFFEEGYFLQIRGTVSERFRQKDNWEFKISSITLLSDLRDKMAKSLTIQLPLQDLSSSLIDELDEIFRENAEQYPERNCALKFTVYDRLKDENIVIDMPSKTFKIFPGNEFLDKLKEHNITYKLN
jgi:DNA polymerase-3 subunit alpha